MNDNEPYDATAHTVPDERIKALHPIWQRLIEEAKGFAWLHRNTNNRDLERLAFVRWVDAINERITPHTPCKSGCDACCHQAVAISQTEADDIARYTSRTLVPQRPFNVHDMRNEALAMVAKIDIDRARYFRVACTFLEHGKCTIYPVRPIACRLHHTIANDATPCAGDWDTRIPKVDLNVVEALHADMTLFEPTADIREWFPRRT